MLPEVYSWPCSIKIDFCWFLIIICFHYFFRKFNFEDFLVKIDFFFFVFFLVKINFHLFYQLFLENRFLPNLLSSIFAYLIEINPINCEPKLILIDFMVQSICDQNWFSLFIEFRKNWFVTFWLFLNKIDFYFCRPKFSSKLIFDNFNAEFILNYHRRKFIFIYFW